jgi:hypothetical protein
MRRNPLADWSIEDIESACLELGITPSPSRGGSSHFKVSHPLLPDILTIPFRRPLKPVYIRRFVRFVDTLGDKRGSV